MLSINWSHVWKMVESIKVPLIVIGVALALSNATAFGDAAVVTIARSGGEGFDLPRDVNKEMADNPYFSYTNNSEEYTDFEDGQGYLELTRPEKDMIELAKNTSTKTVVVFNATNVFQLGELQDDPEINANVSGVFAEEDPFNKDTQTQPSFVNYNDSIYVGYRWYETAAAEGVIDYANAVVYPFGYGLSRYNNVTVEPTPRQWRTRTTPSSISKMARCPRTSWMPLERSTSV